LYDTKIGIIYYYAIHNTIESKITCFKGYQKNEENTVQVSIFGKNKKNSENIKNDKRYL